MCCTVIEVRELEKPVNVPCAYLLGPNDVGGCGVHGQPERPIACQSWRCAWLTGDLSVHLRPDKTGVVAWSEDDPRAPSMFVGLQEATPDAISTTLGRQAKAEMVALTQLRGAFLRVIMYVPPRVSHHALPIAE